MNSSDRPDLSLSQLPRWGWLLGGGVALFLCLGLLVGFGFVLGRGDTLLAGLADPASSTPLVVTATSTPSPFPTDTPVPTSTATPRPDPAIQSLVFAAEVDEAGHPLEPAANFEAGPTEIHAVFDYQGLSADHTWQRIWYLDGQEQLSSDPEPWPGDPAGQFNYFLDTGGTPLPPGRWTLELYVDGELLAEADFTVEPEATPTTNPPPTSTAMPSPSPSPEPSPSPKPDKPVTQHRVYDLLYSKWDGGTHNLYVADTNGHNERLLFTRAAGPSWSPNKKRLFFVGLQGVTQQQRAGQVGCSFGTISDGVVAIDTMSPLRDICQVKPGDWFCQRKQVNLQSAPSDVCTENGISIYQNLDWKVGSARWTSASPDGEAIAFDANPGGDYRIYFLAMLGTSQQFRFELAGEQGSWSPDGQRMVYRSGRNNQTGLWISNRDDSGHTRLAEGGNDAFPTWSPDGQTIAFSRKKHGNVDIYTISPDGTNLRQLTTHPGHDTLPVYTLDGELIFRSDRSGSWGIWKMSGSGADQTEIISQAGLGPDWAYGKMDVR